MSRLAQLGSNGSPHAPGWVASLVVAAALMGCGGAHEGPGSGDGPDSSSARSDGSLTDSGALLIALASSPDGAPVVGNNEIDLEVTRADSGKAESGLELSMVPYMPTMGHGSPVVPRFSDQGDGNYHFDDVVLTMPGLWQLRTQISGAMSDSIDFSFDVK